MSRIVSRIVVLVSAVCALAIAVTAAPVHAEETGSLHGEVTSPVTAVTTIHAQLVDGDTQVSATVLNGSGEWTLPDLPYGTWRLWASSADPTIASQWFSNASTAGAARLIDINSNSDDVGGFSFTLRRGGEIQGKVTGPSGNSLLPAAQIDAIAIFSDDSEVTRVRVAPDGSYHLVGLPVGYYTVQFIDSAGIYHAMFWPSNDATADVKRVYVTADEGGSQLDTVALSGPTPTTSPTPTPKPTPTPTVKPKPVTVTKTGQSVSGVPSSVKRKKSKALPVKTRQGQKLVWKSTTPKICKISKGKVVAKKKKGTCKLTAVAAGTTRLKPYSAKFAIKVK